MEGIAIFIVMMILGSLFKGKKEPEEKPSKTKPFMPQQSQPKQQTPLKKLREASEEMFKEIQQEIRRETEQQKKAIDQHPVHSVPVQSQVKSTPIKVEQTASRKESIKSRKTTRKKIEQPQTAITQTDLLPRNEEDLMKGIIFSEILGPPKSKR